MSEWLQIDSAPKDGTPIIGYQRHDNKAWSVAVIEWDECWTVCAVSYYDVDWTPTHWMPLPTPPGLVISTASDMK